MQSLHVPLTRPTTSKKTSRFLHQNWKMSHKDTWKLHQFSILLKGASFLCVCMFTHDQFLLKSFFDSLLNSPAVAAASCCVAAPKIYWLGRVMHRASRVALMFFFSCLIKIQPFYGKQFKFCPLNVQQGTTRRASGIYVWCEYRDLNISKKRATGGPCERKRKKEKEHKIKNCSFQTHDSVFCFFLIFLFFLWTTRHTIENGIFNFEGI